MHRMYLLAIVSSLLPSMYADPTADGNTPQLPLGFTENRGQAPPGVIYTAAGPGLKAWFKHSGIIIQRGGAGARIDFLGGARNSRIKALNQTGASVNFLTGKDPAKWRTGAPLFSAIRYHGVWPGIDVRYRGEAGRLKSEYLVAAGANLSRVRLRVDGEARILCDGSLAVRNDHGEITEEAPVLFQYGSAGERLPVEGGFKLLDAHTVAFDAVYDHSKELVIDPPILFSGFFGGSAQTQITAVAVTRTNQIVVAGWTSSTDMPGTGGAQSATGGGVDAFVAAFSPAGGQMIYCTYLGGARDDRAYGVAVDSQLNTYIAGSTSSSDFPLAGGVQRALRGTRNAFVAKLNATGTALIYSTYFGGSGVDSASAIAVDSSAGVVITGDSTSTNLAVSTAAFQKQLAGPQNAFVAHLNATGTAVLGATYLGGSGSEHGAAVQVDAAGRIYVGGSTTSIDLPVASAYQAQSGGGQDGFVAALAPDTSGLIFSTYLGGSSGDALLPEAVNGLALDPGGNVIIAGTTSSADFPVTPGAFQTVFGGQTDGFITKLSHAGQMISSTYLGGSQTDGITSLALDFHGLPHVAGLTGSADFPTRLPMQNANAGLFDAFVAKFNAGLSGLNFSTYLGGVQGDGANAITVDAQTGIIVAGETQSADFPASGSVGQSIHGQVSSFVTKISPGFSLGFVVSPYFFRDTWHIRGYSGVAANTVTSFGNRGDIPVAGDWDGAGNVRIGSFRNGVWYLDINGNGVFDAGDKTVNFGQAGDIPVVGDWNGTGQIKLGVFRAGMFLLDLSGHLSGVATGNADAWFAFGAPGDLPIVADWNGSGTTKVGVFRAGQWIVDFDGDRAFTAADQTWTYGQAGDLPVPGDWDGSGTAKIGVYRNGLWVLDYDGDRAITSWAANELVIGYGGPSLLFKPLEW